MKVLVCIKQVPDMESKFIIDGSGAWMVEDDLAFRMNEYDEFAVEQAVLLKEQVKEADVTVISAGPERVKEMIKKALAMGCDRGVHVLDEEVHKKDALQVASMLSGFAKDKGFDLIFTGMQSQDLGTAQVGTLMGEMLGVPSVSTVVEFSYADGGLILKRELEGGLKAIVKLNTPAVLTCQMGLNKPRFPTLPNIMKAKKKELSTVTAGELLSKENLAEAERLEFPEKKGAGVVLEGDVGESVGKLIDILREKTNAL